MCKIVFIIFIISIQLTLIQNTKYLKNFPIRKEYFKYLTQVVSYICHQTGLHSINNDLLIQDSGNIISVEELMALKIDENNFLRIFSYIVSVFNFKYIEILQTFVEHINIIIEECEKYLTAKLFYNFINCTSLLEIGMTKSTVMFNSIYQVMWFLSYLDVKRIFVKIPGNPYTVVDEVYLAKQFIDSIQIKDQTYLAINQDEYNQSKINEALLVISNTKELIKNVTERAISVLNDISTVFIIPQRPDLKYKYKEEYLSQKCIENHLFLFVLKGLNSFYTNTKENYYDNFNFDILLNPNAHNMQHLIHPLDYSLQQFTEVKILKILVENGEWKTVDHISIILNGQVISANRIVRDPVSVHGFNLKKQYIIQLLNCKFFEIFSNYFSYLTPIVQFCHNEKLKLTEFSESNILTYMNCIKILFETIKSTEYFFTKIFSVVKKLKEESIWEVKSAHISLSFIEKLLNLIIKTFNDNYLYEELFKNRLEIFHLKSVDLYLKNMIKQRSILNRLLYYKKKGKKSCQFIGKSSPFIGNPEETANENDYLKKIDTIVDYQNACMELSTFCKNFINIDFKDMGWDKIF
ncbi:uncharacterized protein LOC126904810 isoform X2 [Daktulosphaira vitifoliae]|uniref:uncharacterized protein LOC126904810 isoform X2 n=1 Tax=Daktulosphaira vitifoliae TaxID=58002 RepID=UPI0021AA01F6|nr:uncharacterized protein LOC126904810 isoform X2 [Daktulosphaira vitifoliae]